MKVEIRYHFERRYRDKLAKAFEQKWLITFPDGSVKVISNLVRFCKENKLNHSNMYQVMLGKTKRKSEKGYKCVKLENYLR